MITEMRLSVYGRIIPPSPLVYSLIVVKSQVLGKHIEQGADPVKIIGPGKGHAALPASNRLGVGDSYLFSDIFPRPAPASALSPKLLIGELPGNAAHISLLSSEYRGSS